MVVQSNWLNRTDTNTIVCPIATNVALASKPGNVRLAMGEANLAKPSVVLQGLLLVLEPDA